MVIKMAVATLLKTEVLAAVVKVRRRLGLAPKHLLPEQLDTVMTVGREMVIPAAVVVDQEPPDQLGLEMKVVRQVLAENFLILILTAQIQVMLNQLSMALALAKDTLREAVVVALGQEVHLLSVEPPELVEAEKVVAMVPLVVEQQPLV